MNWRERLNRFMAGRYGQDEFSAFLMIVTLILLVLESIIRVPFLSMVTLLLLAYSWFRILSRNIPARYAENQKFLELRGRVTGFFRNRGNRAEDLKNFHIYRCPKCGQKIRIPRGKGMIVITCPKCRTEFRRCWTSVRCSTTLCRARQPTVWNDWYR